jgi:hypothetical protein
MKTCATPHVLARGAVSAVQAHEAAATVQQLRAQLARESASCQQQAATTAAAVSRQLGSSQALAQAEQLLEVIGQGRGQGRRWLHPATHCTVSFTCGGWGDMQRAVAGNLHVTPVGLTPQIPGSGQQPCRHVMQPCSLSPAYCRTPSAPCFPASAPPSCWPPVPHHSSCLRSTFSPPPPPLAFPYQPLPNYTHHRRRGVRLPPCRTSCWPWPPPAWRSCGISCLVRRPPGWAQQQVVAQPRGRACLLLWWLISRCAEGVLWAAVGEQSGATSSCFAQLAGPAPPTPSFHFHMVLTKPGHCRWYS